ncbi:Autophagy-related protein 11 [Emericellopsis cladophorae]|uniref:Autophagy-related protein 11 n=1 Tax=Emericellopsis cladophorae TaxID=2686198 RepID=A0A9P9Y642_9HYPO|nr:Autophagy-related protein 11 [Emericellopsis cladophorae]KAI6783735.1 Autophagy-related protein 11 [Emericellopsis cladophorae]
MATQVLIAHTGRRLEVDTAQFSNLDEFKAWVSKHGAVPTQHFVALTPQGRAIKPTGLWNEKDIFVYDARTTQRQSQGSPTIVSKLPSPKPPAIPAAPNMIEDVKAIGSWQKLCESRRTWALRVADDCGQMDSTVRARFDEIDVMIKCLDAAIINLEISVKQIEPKHTELKKWVAPALEEHSRLASSWQQYLELASNVPVAPAMVKFMTRGAVTKGAHTLEDLIEPETAKKAGKLAATANRRFSEKATELDRTTNRMYEDLQQLIGEFDALTNRSVLARHDESSQIVQDIEPVSKQLDADYKTVLTYSDAQKDVAQASKTASIHTERLVPNLQKRAQEMAELMRYATEARNAIAADAVSFMRAITEVTSLRGNVKDQINLLNQSEDDLTTFDYLRLIQQLPYMYASFVAEAVRRHEWNDKVKADSTTLANEMALFQDEESKRRRRWQKMVGSTYGPGLDTNVMGLEVSVMGDDTSWPPMSKQELDSYYDTLRGLATEEAILEDIAQLIQEISSPTKQQSKRVKAFKNGSVFEAALGRSGLMIRGDDDLLRTLQEDKMKLDSKLKTAESRVRRLEDLLHRQSQASRPGNLFQPGHERNGSISSIKSSRPDGQQAVTDGTDAMVRRIAELENELKEEKQNSARMQTELAANAVQYGNMKDQFTEANTTKKDLLENMEAFKREFLEERKSLEDEIRDLHARLENTEDEMEHLGDSKERARTSHETKIEQLQAELERLSEQHRDESQKAQGQVKFLRNDARMLHDQRETQERELESVRETGRHVAKQLEALGVVADGYLGSLKTLHDYIGPQDSMPEDADLGDVLQEAATKLLSRLEGLQSDTDIVRNDLEETRSAGKTLRDELTATEQRLASEEAASLKARNEVAEESAKVEALETELAGVMEELRKLRARLDDGESGSGTLQKQLEDEEKKVVNLTEQLAARQSRVGSLEEEARMYKEKAEDSQGKLSELQRRFESRDERSKDLTQRLYSQNDRMCHLLERLGYAVSRSDGSITITKVPRAERATQNPNDSSDPGSSLRKSSVFKPGMLGAKALHDSADLDLLNWANSHDLDGEDERYKVFVSKLGDFDVDQFSDTVYQKIKEVEHKARKWQKEAKSYRDRAHAEHKDAHNKLAFKSFKEGDLALFLPTRNQQAGAWAAFNVGAPHYFLREQDAHRLRHREWLVARITRIQERVVDLSRSMQSGNDEESINDENENPFQLSDGLRWYLIDAQEDKPGAPSTPGMGKSTVAANTVEATANIHTHAVISKGKPKDSAAGLEKTLSKSLESRRSSSSSKRAVPLTSAGAQALLKPGVVVSETNSLRAAAPETPSATSPTQPGSPLSARPPATDRDLAGPSRAKGKAAVPADNDSAKPSEVRQVDTLFGP